MHKAIDEAISDAPTHVMAVIAVLQAVRGVAKVTDITMSLL